MTVISMPNSPDHSIKASIVITCYNQAKFLAEAIESVRNQTFSDLEIIVVDDGSTDKTAAVAACYPDVRYVRQENRGLSAARNLGLHVSAGEYLVFLDADDRLLPIAVESGVDCLNTHPECAFVSGDYTLITSEGLVIPRRPTLSIERDHYLALLRRNYIGMHATVMYRRSIFETSGDFDTSLKACEDYDLYLRIARIAPVYCHDKVVAEYRQHAANMSKNRALMLKSAVSRVQSQRKYVRKDARRQEAYKNGVRFWQAYFGDGLVAEVQHRITCKEWRQAGEGLVTLLQYYPRGFAITALQTFHRVLFRARRVILRSAKF